MAGESWAPTLSDVARHVPTRTRDTKSPGSDALLNTFNANTTPTDEQAQAVIDDAVASLIALYGALPTGVTEQAMIQEAARSAVEWRAAADIELAYPNRDADVRLYDQLNTRAALALTQYATALSAVTSGGGPADLIPIWGFPDPPPYADQSPGSGADFIVTPTVIPNG